MLKKSFYIKIFYYTKYIEWFIDFSAINKINKIDNLACVIIHDNLTCRLS